MSSTNLPKAKREWHGTHHSWSYRPEAFRWLGERIAGVNILPLAGDMRAWMLRRGQLALMPKPMPPEKGGFTNPYTTGGVTLQLIMARVINSSHDFATIDCPGNNEVDSEIERIRLYNEVLMNSARLCEVAIKQLLYCTQIPEARYGRMALGALLESPCPDCKRQSGQTPHLVSLVGTLAHPFHLCLEFEHCAMDHMDLVNRLRNSLAAHSGVQQLDVRSVSASKAQFKSDSQEVLSGLLHMLSHVEDLERRMLTDLTKKGREINALKAGGLAAKDCNFNLVPGDEGAVLPAPSSA
ncbi:hypothetical protein [Comamonas thiooxydans]|uniref:hypothetical protein n=1 Tax=Comamonas thiooxydans TaxID=363952 RepID=UPI001111C1B4|nr:hypothetical protein [Comamonas thiooxydans]